MRTLRAVGAVVGGLTLLGFGPGVAHAQFTFSLYENWTNSDGSPNLKIRSGRWVGMDFGGQEILREIDLNAAGVPVLNFRLRQEGQTVDNTGSFFAGNGLRFRHPETLTRVYAKFKIVQTQISPHCPANTTNTTDARPARIFWVVFNDGSSSGPGDRTGDHQFDIKAVRRADSLDPPGVFQVFADDCRCPNATCNFTGLPEQCSSIQLPSVQVGPAFALQAIWDPAGASDAKFRVAVVGMGPEQTLGYPSTTPPDPALNPAINQTAQIEPGGLAANCTVAAGGPTEFDERSQVKKVKTNPEAVVP